MAEAPTTPKKKRLVVCCDGTWNRQDDGTNVLHVFHHVQEGRGADGVEQRRWYDEGVGTGVLDGVTGGAFGIGLERNVREAMNWLVANYDDGDDLYVFGFSRGAYTARSLVAFLAVCGIPRRGAPLTVNQLWEGYCLHGRDDDGRRNWWEKLVGELALPFRNVSNLVRDPWRDALPPDEWRSTRRYKPWREPTGLNATEQVLQQWTRRPPITYLGLFDTVGALGIDALAIPGLRGRMATHHNMRLHSTVASARHALAIDEHRRSFAETPLSEWVPQGQDAIDFGGTISQRWFVGAHSNVGGGYATNVLASEPLAWILDGAAAMGLALREHVASTAPTPAAMRACLRDSYTEFGWFYGHLLRAKRHYRRIAPPAEARGGHGENAARGGRRLHAMRPIADDLAPGVTALLQDTTTTPRYTPPNLVDYAVRMRLPGAEAMRLGCHHAWLGRGFAGAVGVVAWATMAVVGAVHAPQLFAQSWPQPPTWPVLAGLGALGVLLDWSESRLNFARALAPERGAIAALRDVLFWCRATAVLLALLGAMVTGWAAWCALPVASSSPTLSFAAFVPWLAPLGGASAAALLLQCERGHARKPSTSRVSAWLLGVVLVAAVLLPLAMRSATALLFGGPEPQPFAAFAANEPAAAYAGLLLLLEVLLLLMIQSLLSWVGEPLQNVRLGSILQLQRRVTATQVHQQLAAWSTALVRRPMRNDPPDGLDPRQRAAALLGRALGQSLWRDSLGFVPLYTALFVVAGWFATSHGHCAWLAGRNDATLWIVGVPLAVAGLDLVENTLHGWFLRRFVAGAPIPGWAALLGAAATLGKALGFVTGLVVVHGAIFAAATRLCVDTTLTASGWRGAVAVLLAAAIGVALVGQLLLWVRELLFPAARRHAEPPALAKG
ncbi:MAG: DUF2235 domain-containing protein [Planctomycetes bacterium]|nr:DUF2235 domain-containing protein [Planctomycetota bacterium]